ncbi:MAG: HEAT repeat domain-containing protein [Desulfobacterales bacterium]|nr:HEAT repeat domain-containing protein [Desulfobacterales bacterium]MDJ0883542.1 HEAT repeat domain-containing protein [Desulfobacterales bacterium]
MRFQDIFVPRWQHSNPEVRIKAVNRMNDKSLLMQIAEKDEDEMVCMAARDRLSEISDERVKVET